MEIDGDSEFVKMFAPLDFIGYVRILKDINGYYWITWDIIGYIKGLKCLPHGYHMDTFGYVGNILF